MAPRNTVLVGDVRDRLAELPSASIDCVVTSPPYYLLRDYGMPGQMGLESHVVHWVEEMRRVLGEISRVLKPEGSAWLNLGDTYSRHARYGARAKSLLLAPERLLIALVDDGWVVRNKAIWHKPNAMPESVTDRLSTTYDFFFLLTRSRRYFFDLDLIREPHRLSPDRPATAAPSKPASWAGPFAGTQSGLHRARLAGTPGHLLGKNPGDVWRVAAATYRGAHFATFPEGVVMRPLLASCPERVCKSCGSPWRRDSERLVIKGTRRTDIKRGLVRKFPHRWETAGHLHEVRQLCRCRADWQPGLVLDPFFGSGTVGVVAQKLGRDWLGIELNPDYVALAKERLDLAETKRQPKSLAA